jgi:hypothetical protein
VQDGTLWCNAGDRTVELTLESLIES